MAVNASRDTIIVFVATHEKSLKGVSISMCEDFHPVELSKEVSSAQCGAIH